MSEAFLKYDESNPPAGVDSRGVLGADAVIVVDPEHMGVLDNTALSFAKGSVKDILAKLERGQVPCVVLDHRYMYGETPCGGFSTAVCVLRSNNFMDLKFIVNNNMYYIQRADNSEDWNVGKLQIG